MAEVRTVQIQQWQKRIQAGDRTAWGELVEAVCQNLENLARKMLKKYPNVHRWEQTDDVLQNALLRLLRSLEKLQPRSMREFYALATLELRRELLDLSRQWCGKYGEGANHASKAGNLETTAPAEQSGDEVQKWTAFHESVEQLPTEEREVVGLMFYHGWSAAEIGELFQVSERTVRRWWQSALLKLHEKMDGMDFLT